MIGHQPPRPPSESEKPVRTGDSGGKILPFRRPPVPRPSWPDDDPDPGNAA